jgi:hypothetical protein
VLDREHGVETGCFRQANQTTRALRVGKHVVAEVQGKFHGGGSFPGGSAFDRRRSEAIMARGEAGGEAHFHGSVPAHAACSSGPTLRILQPGRT